MGLAGPMYSWSGENDFGMIPGTDAGSKETCDRVSETSLDSNLVNQSGRKSSSP